MFKSPEMVKGALFIANIGSVVTDIPATSSATPSLISKLSIAMSPYHWVPLPSAPTEAVTLNITVSEKVPKQTVS